MRSESLCEGAKRSAPRCNLLRSVHIPIGAARQTFSWHTHPVRRAMEKGSRALLAALSEHESTGPLLRYGAPKIENGEPVPVPRLIQFAVRLPWHGSAERCQRCAPQERCDHAISIYACPVESYLLRSAYLLLTPLHDELQVRAVIFTDSSRTPFAGALLGAQAQILRGVCVLGSVAVRSTS
jgi:hypothetical protein